MVAVEVVEAVVLEGEVEAAAVEIENGIIAVFAISQASDASEKEKESGGNQNETNKGF